MEWTAVSPADGSLWEKTWKLYEESFPVSERRTLADHLRAMSDSRFHCRIVRDADEVWGLLFHWRWGRMVFIEHIAVNPSARGRGIGSRMLHGFLEAHPDSQTVLEIDPPVDDVSRRRLEFYRRAGFCQTGFSYVHPSYRLDGHPHPLVLLSHPEPIGRAGFERFKRRMFGEVMRYAQTTPEITGIVIPSEVRSTDEESEK